MAQQQHPMAHIKCASDLIDLAGCHYKKKVFEFDFNDEIDHPKKAALYRLMRQFDDIDECKHLRIICLGSKFTAEEKRVKLRLQDINLKNNTDLNQSLQFNSVIDINSNEAEPKEVKESDKEDVVKVVLFLSILFVSYTHTIRLF